MYVVFWLAGNPRPDLDRITRPLAWCPACEREIRAIQAWKKPDNPWGRYRAQYVYRCPNVACQNRIVEPGWLPAATIIDWSNIGTRIGDRERPLAEKTLRRIQAGIDRYWTPLVVEATGNTYDAADPKHPAHGTKAGYMRAWPTGDPLRTLHTSGSKGVAVPPLMVPVEGRDGKNATLADAALRTLTTRNETAIGVPPYVVEMYGTSTTREVSAPLSTLTAGGNHHALITAYYGNSLAPTSTSSPVPTMRTTEHLGLLLANRFNNVPTSVCDPASTFTTATTMGLITRMNNREGNLGSLSTPASEAIRTLTTAGHQAVLQPGETVDIDDVYFRMLEPTEAQRGMAFPDSYVMLGNRREKFRLAGNAVTPPVPRDIINVVVDSLSKAA